MKKTISLLVLILGLTSCSEDLVFNDPAFVGYKNSELWEASSFRANVDTFGDLTITGVRGAETVNLKTDNTLEKTYSLGNTVSSVVFEGASGKVYSTNNIPNPEVQIYPSEGSIVLAEYNLIERTVSGTFTFTAYDAAGLETENFNRGYFHNVPIVDIAVVNGTDVNVACQNATAVVVTTEVNLNNVNPTGTQYTEFCEAYKTALQVKKTACGDTDGGIQALINGLGDCSN
ncbi:DUF6252 family protein [Olleya sp. HaHaR_3_96]|uniref:DUF6252 family protein n=1 Tax=Olleya sp. HaHaR_3_96 TaxID=2745560 RepID=UPI001C4EA85D|nr:DUF6252 family protein [Olleya sp. HaHaR_3_96]QXP60308.1 membrane lipoprotein lipid attachment site-containing protein [Olleya sp. HaHaR_3_96]